MILGCWLSSAAGAAQENATAAYPQERFGAYLDSVEGLAGPVDAVFLEDGSLLVAERDADRLLCIAPNGTRNAFGPAGLDAPEDVAVQGSAEARRFLVADTGNGRVLELDAAGELLREIGAKHLRAPKGVAGHGERVYAADPAAGRIAVFAADGSLAATLEAPLRRPVALEVGTDGRVFAVDLESHRVEVFDSAGKHLFGMGDFGPHAGLLGHPRDVALWGERILVADADNHRIEALGLGGGYVYEWGKHALRPREGQGSLHYPSGIAIAPDGQRAVVCEAFGDRLQVFGHTAEDPQRFMTDPTLIPWLVAPHYGPAIATDGDLLITYEPETQQVLAHDLELDEPVLLARFSSFGDGPGLEREITGLCLDAARQRLYVCDRASGTLSTYALDHDPEAPLRMNERMASFVREELLPPTPDGRRRAPLALARAFDGALAVVDEAERAVMLVREGRLVETLTGFDEPVDVAFGAGELYVADRGARRLVALDAQGARREIVGCERPRGVAVASDGEVYATDETAHRVRVFGPDGALRREFGRKGIGPRELYRPAGIALDSKGRVIVLDHGNHRGMIFSRAGEFLVAFGPRSYVRPTLDDASDR